MAEHKGYRIEAVIEDSLDSAKKEIKRKSYRASAGEKIIAAGLPTIEAAKAAIDHRCKLRGRSGLDLVG